MANDNKGIILLGGLVAVVGAAYLYFKNACATPPAAGSSWPPASICALSMFAPAAPAASAPSTMTAALCAASGGIWNAATSLCAAPTANPATGGNPTPPTSPTATDPWANAIALMKQNAGSDSANFDTWAWQFQYQPRPASPALPTGYGNNNYITPAVMQAVITAGGGDRTAMISAETFIGYLKTALANAGLSGYEVPVWLIHRGGMS